jgi:hypothetical protein
MAYDPANGTVVQFGDESFPGNSVQDDTWTWDGHNWTKQHPETHPPGRGLPAVAYDPAHHNVVLFGGVTGTRSHPTFLNDTWTWDGTDWTRQHPDVSPPARFAASLVTDPTTHSVLLFGGVVAGFANLSDTWTWDGTNWTERHPVTIPQADSSMAPDPATHTIVAFGGGSAFNPSTPLVDSTWTWDGTNWTLQNPAHHPSARQLAGMAFDAAAGNVLLFSGLIGPFVGSDQTWTWDGTDWTQQHPAHHPRPRLPVMTTDPATCGVLLFGGESPSFGPVVGTWVYASARDHEDRPIWHGRCDRDREANGRSH